MLCAIYILSVSKNQLFDALITHALQSVLHVAKGLTHNYLQRGINKKDGLEPKIGRL